MPLHRTLLVALGLLLALPAVSGGPRGHGRGPDPARRDGRVARPKIRAQAPRLSFDDDDPSAPVVLPNSDDDEDDGDGEAIGRSQGGAPAMAPWACARRAEPAGPLGRSPRGPRRSPARAVPIRFRC